MIHAWQIYPLKILTTQVVTGAVGKAYSFSMTASGGAPPYTWSVVLGKLPPGVSLDEANGVMKGTPTQVGNYSVTIQASDSTLGQAQSAMVGLDISVGPPPLIIITPSLPGAIAGQSYALQLQASGGTPPYTWVVSEGALPLGLKLDPLMGIISGIPDQPETCSFTIEVTDSSDPQLTAQWPLGGYSAAGGR